MQATVFRYKRAKGKCSTQWVGRYRFDDMPRYVEVPLHTADELVARKRLQDIITRKQREAEGLAAPAPMRAAMHAKFAELVGDYAADLHAQGRVGRHIKDSTRRVLRIATECGWQTIGEANAPAFTRWRSKVAPTLSAKMVKEYGVSLRAFFRWLIDTERFDRDPFARVKPPATRGREVRVRRAFTIEEARRLLAVADYHRLPYLILFYTGLRYKAAWGLRWCDYLADSPAGPRFGLPAARDKGRRERVIPVRPELAREIEAHRQDRPRALPTDRICAGIFPRQRTDKRRPNGLRLDLAKAGIPVKDALGRVLDYHSFLTTFGTRSAASGVPQRATQALMGHATAEMTAKHYTDETVLGLSGQVLKMEWVGAEPSRGNDTLEGVSGRVSDSARLAEIVLNQLFAMVDATGLEPVTPSV